MQLKNRRGYGWVSTRISLLPRLRIQEKEAPPNGVISTLTIAATQVEDVS